VSGNVSNRPNQPGREALGSDHGRNIFPRFRQLVEQLLVEETCAVIETEEGEFFFSSPKGGMQVWPAGRGRVLPEEAEQPAPSDGQQSNQGDGADSEFRDYPGYRRRDESARVVEPESSGGRESGGDSGNVGGESNGKESGEVTEAAERESESDRDSADGR
jgi:hypothetical protein